MDIRLITWQEVLPIRHTVLWPNKPPMFCKVDGDEDASHYGVYIQDKLVCVASIYIDNQKKCARLRKFATLGEYQGKGIGRQLIKYIIEELKVMAIESFWCDARSTAVGFYQKFNMREQGKEFIKSEVLYFKMLVNFT